MLLEAMKARLENYDCANGWYVLTIGMVWNVALIIEGKIKRTKQVGKVKMSGTNYFDEACQLANARNKTDGYTFESNTYSHIPRIAK